MVMLGDAPLTDPLSDILRELEGLREQEAEFRSVFEHAAVGIGIIAMDGTFLRANPMFGRMCGLAPAELEGRSLMDVVHPEDRLRVGGTLEQVATGEIEQVVIEHRMVWREGEIIDVRVSAAPIRGVDGRVARMVGVVEDVTERNRAVRERVDLEAKIRHAQKLESLGVLAGGIAHDFNNLLVGMLGNASLALMELAPGAAARPFVQDIEKTATRAGELARQMLAYSGKGRFLVERLELGQLVEEMVHLIEASISKKAALRYEFAPGLPGVDVDATQLRQVVMNLITNASDALGETSGTIHVSTGVKDCDRAFLRSTYLDEDLPAGTYVYLEVSDTGCGMSAPVRSRIFDPFFTTKFQGRGLGMAAVLGIVRGHRGALQVSSEEGRGTTIRVLLPTATGTAEDTETSSFDLAVLETGGRILLVDDEQTVRTVARHMLERLGYEVVEATDGEDAVRIFGEDPGAFSGVLLDLTMPKMDGEVCFRELRHIRPGVRVLLSSGYNEQDLIARFAGQGLAGFIQKPYRVAALGKALARALHPGSPTE